MAKQMSLDGNTSPIASASPRLPRVRHALKNTLLLAESIFLITSSSYAYSKGHEFDKGRLNGPTNLRFESNGAYSRASYAISNYERAQEHLNSELARLWPQMSLENASDLKTYMLLITSICNDYFGASKSKINPTSDNLSDVYSVPSDSAFIDCDVQLRTITDNLCARGFRTGIVVVDPKDSLRTKQIQESGDSTYTLHALLGVNAPNGTPLYFEPISGHCYASLEEVRRNYFVLGSAGLGVEDAYAHYIRARQLAQEGFPFLARQDFEEAIQKAPSLTLAYASLAKSLEVLGETSEALRVLDTAISKNPQPYFLRQRAYFKYELKDYEGALKDIQACLESDPRYPNALSLEKFLLSKLK